MIVVVMGVSGVGKTTVATALAARLRADFVEADELHPAANVEKMRRGEPLDDGDRAPWLAAVAARIAALADARRDGVVACSALKASYRDELRGARAAGEVRFVLLEAPAALIRERLAARRGHFMPPSLLDSQLTTLEETPDLVVVDAARPPDAIVDEIVARLAAA